MIRYDMTWDQLKEDPHAAFRQARELSPAGWCEPLGGVAVLTHAGCRDVLRGTGRFETQKAGSKPHEVIGASMLTSDGPQHRRLRTPFDPFFRPRVVHEDLQPLIDAELDVILRRLARRSHIALGDDIARVLPVAVISRILGLTLDPRDLRTTYDRFAASLGDYEGSEADSAARVARAELEQTLADQLRSGNDGVLAGLADPARHGLSPEEVITNALIVMFGAIETVETLIVNTVSCALKTPTTWRQLAGHPDQVEALVNETLRWAPPVGFVGRVAVGDQQIEGVAVADGALVLVVQMAGNRDPEVFENPDSFDPRRREAGAHLAFGYGPHGCMGNSLARHVVRTVIDRLAVDHPQLELDPEEAAEPFHGFPFHRPEEIHLRW